MENFLLQIRARRSLHTTRIGCRLRPQRLKQLNAVLCASGREGVGWTSSNGSKVKLPILPINPLLLLLLLSLFRSTIEREAEWGVGVTSFSGVGRNLSIHSQMGE